MNVMMRRPVVETRVKKERGLRAARANDVSAV
jgi:hypothetical protein